MEKSKYTHKLAAAMTTGLLISQVTAANAANVTFSDVSNNIVTSTGSLPSLVSTVAYIGGIGLGVAGVFKLKNHVDNPGQTPMKDGLVRLGAGGGLLGLPFVTEAMQGTIGTGTSPTCPASKAYNRRLPVDLLQFMRGAAFTHKAAPWHEN